MKTIVLAMAVIMSFSSFAGSKVGTENLIKEAITHQLETNRGYNCEIEEDRDGYIIKIDRKVIAQTIKSVDYKFEESNFAGESALMGLYETPKNKEQLIVVLSKDKKTIEKVIHFSKYFKMETKNQGTVVDPIFKKIKVEDTSTQVVCNLIR